MTTNIKKNVSLVTGLRVPQLDQPPLQFKLVEVVVAHWALLQPAPCIVHGIVHFRGFPRALKSKPVLINIEQRQRNIEIRNMPPRKRPGPKEPLYTISWPPLKLQFQFDHTRRVVDAGSRIDAIQIGPVDS